MYRIYDFEDKRNELVTSVRKFDWTRGLPGGWLDYGPPRQVTGYGDGSLIRDSGERYGKKWNLTAWSASVPYTNMTAVTETHPIPNHFLKTGIMREVREALKNFGAMVDDSTGTGIWCNFYDKDEDLISAHKDDENYYERNFENQPLFVSLTLYDDKDLGVKNLARFQIKEKGEWMTIPLPHLSLLVMSGNVEHRVMKYTGKNFRKRYNITFRTPVSIKDDVVKNFRFFSNFGRYYRKTYLLFVPDNVFTEELPKQKEILVFFPYKDHAMATGGKVFETLGDGSKYCKVLYAHSKIDGEVLISRNLDLDRDELMEKIRRKFKSGEKAPNTTTNHALYIMLNQNFGLK